MNRKIRLFAASVILLLFAVCLFGCVQKGEGPKGTMTVDLVTDRDGSSYTVRNGCEKVSFCVENGKTCGVGLTVKKQSGKLNIRIEEDGSGKQIYCGKDLPTSQFTVIAGEAGDYTVYIEAENFVGEYQTVLNYPQ